MKAKSKAVAGWADVIHAKNPSTTLAPTFGSQLGCPAPLAKDHSFALMVTCAAKIRIIPSL